jgi:hypothetical protein
MHGQAYLAETSIGQALEADDIVKVVCAYQAADAPIPVLER